MNIFECVCMYIVMYMDICVHVVYMNVYVKTIGYLFQQLKGTKI